MLYLRYSEFHLSSTRLNSHTIYVLFYYCSKNRQQEIQIQIQITAANINSSCNSVKLPFSKKDAFLWYKKKWKFVTVFSVFICYSTRKSVNFCKRCRICLYFSTFPYIFKVWALKGYESSYAMLSYAWESTSIYTI